MADTQDLIVDLKIRDNLSVGLANAKTSLGGLDAQVTKTQAGLGSMASSIQNLVTGFLAFRGVSAVIGFLTDSAKAAAEEEAGIRQLGQSLRANIPAWDGNTKAIEARISAGAALSFSDDELRSSLAALVASTHSVNEAFKIQALAQDLARFKNEDLAAATDELIKVQAGSFRSLKSLGIALKEGATAAEAFGKIQEVVAGQSQAFADTTEAKMTKASIAIHNLQEDIGVGLLPVIGQLADALDNVFRDRSPEVIDKTAEFVKTATIDQIKSAREGIAAELAKAHDVPPSVIIAMRDSIKVLDDALNQANDGLSEGARFGAAYAAQLVASAKAADDLAASTSSQAQIDFATATIKATQAHKDLAEALVAGAAAGPGNAAAMRDVADAQVADAIATIKVKEAQDALTLSLAKVPPVMLGAGHGTDTYSDALLTLANNANIAKLALDGAAKAATPFIIGDVHLGTTTGTPGAGTIATLQAQESAAAAVEARRLKALQDAKTAADAYANTLAGKLDAALTKEKSLADTLFDALHARHLQAIADTEKLAEAQHSTAVQAISDALRLKLETNAAPVNAAEEAQRRIELTRQRRGLNEGLQSALASGDPTAIRNAQEALQSFNADQRIAALKLTQSKLDLAAQTEAAAANKLADDKLAAAKTAQADAIEAETKRAKKQQDDFDRALAALKVRDKGASPEKFNKDLDALNTKFGITTDAQGFHHIADVLSIAIKNVKIPAPINNFTVTVTSPPIFLNGRLIAAALSSSQSPAATPGVRTGTLTPRP